MKPLTIIIWVSAAVYGFIFLLYHLWLRPVYHIARTGKILTASQKFAFRLHTFINPAAALVIGIFFIAIIIRVLALVIKSEF